VQDRPHRAAHWKRSLLLAVLLGLLLLWPDSNFAASTWLEAGDRLLAQGELLRAEEAYATARSAGASGPDLRLREGRVLLTQGRLEEAEAAFRDAARGATLAQAWIGLGDTAARQGDLTQAISWWRASLGVQESGPAWARVGWAESARGRFREAELALRQAWEMGEKRCLVSYGLAALLAVDKPDEASRWLQEPCTEGFWAETCTWWPALSPGTLRPETLQEALDEAQKSENDLLRASILGRAYTRLGLHALAERAWLSVLSQRPDWGTAWAYLGHARAAQDKAAQEDLQRAVALEPDSAMARYFLGRWFARNHLSHSAAETFRKGLEIEPDNAGLMLELAYALSGQGDYARAKEVLKMAGDLDPEDVRVQLAIARFYLEHLIEVREKGRPAAELAIQLAPEDGKAHDLLGWAAWLIGDPDLAEEELHRALELSPQLPAAWYHQAVIHATQGRVVAAREAYVRVIVLDPGGYYGSRAAKALREMQLRSGQ